MNDKIQYLTQAGYDTFVKEREILKDKTIPAIATKIDEAKQQGDLSENAEYHQAKEEMAWAQGRLLELNYILENAQILTNAGSKDKIEIGSIVKFKNNQNITKEYTIVGPQEADPANNRVSNESPLGSAFIGHKTGEVISVNTPAGTQTYTILEIK
ncbi:MAG: transcription elongation factor GreA [Candidatus Magasanikbacteria bacterium CG10_big_fil_rev_8_21_14_0_10_40_10]|uniref:Transcription elongation factor GreA n=1 Tax=Candidatus Magasanikbacteria bacterium CG10_big_fil_rev_8_21_14_0_10_40_10 TaxID=1974648 RepID=A0A2M6W568_9BACT|nr:MAG: transcription elongation factor GreA [Candidatus Magasanikbacteria bacterium CG10_big_fil_rev_8_21_14_0_10_40_10]